MVFLDGAILPNLTYDLLVVTLTSINTRVLTFSLTSAVKLIDCRLAADRFRAAVSRSE